MWILHFACFVSLLPTFPWYFSGQKINIPLYLQGVGSQIILTHLNFHKVWLADSLHHELCYAVPLLHWVEFCRQVEQYHPHIPSVVPVNNSSTDVKMALPGQTGSEMHRWKRRSLWILCEFVSWMFRKVGATVGGGGGGVMEGAGVRAVLEMQGINKRRPMIIERFFGVKWSHRQDERSPSWKGLRPTGKLFVHHMYYFQTTFMPNTSEEQKRPKNHIYDLHGRKSSGFNEERWLKIRNQSHTWSTLWSQ